MPCLQHVQRFTDETTTTQCVCISRRSLQVQRSPHPQLDIWSAAPLDPQVWDLTKRSRTAAHTLASPVPGPQRFKATRLAFCRDGSDGDRQPGAAHMAVYWAADEAPADEPPAGDAPGSSGYAAVYQLSTEAAGATQFDPALLAVLPVCDAASARTSGGSFHVVPLSKLFVRVPSDLNQSGTRAPAVTGVTF